MSPWDEKSKNDQFKQLEKANAIGAFVTKSFTKIRDFYASNGSADSVMNCDTAAMMWRQGTVLCLLRRKP